MAKKKSLKKLQDQLVGLLPDIDEEGMLFLIKQANTIIYNLKVDELNKQAEVLDKSRNKVSTTLKRKNSNTQKAEGGTSEYPVTVERGAFGTSYIMALGNTRKTFAEHEMLGLVKVCHAAGNKSDGMARVYRWLNRYRDDVLLDAGIGSARHPVLHSVYTTLRNTFKIRE